MTGAVVYLTRLAVKNPEVTWHPKKNQEPWEEYKDKTYKVCLFIVVLLLNCNHFMDSPYVILYLINYYSLMNREKKKLLYKTISTHKCMKYITSTTKNVMGKRLVDQSFHSYNF